MQICFRVITLFACFILTGMSAQAQTYPSKPVRIVVPLPAGGAVDTIIRAVSQRLSDIWGQQIVIENKSGANTQIGAEAVARSAPDGYTLLATAETTFVVNPYLYPKLSYGVADFVPVIGIGRADQALNVHASVAANSVADMIAMAKARPGAINYGSIGIGSSSHLNTVLFEMMAGVKLSPVHYRGGAPAISDLVGGHIPMLFISFPSVREHVKAGRIKMLGVGASKRLASLPDVPTIAETVPGYDGSACLRRRRRRRILLRRSMPTCSACTPTRNSGRTSSLCTPTSRSSLRRRSLPTTSRRMRCAGAR